MICHFNDSLRCAPRPCSFGTRIDDIDRKFERSVDVALFLVAAHMDVGVVRSAIRELVNQPRTSMEVEDHGFVSGEQGIDSRSERPCGCSVAGCKAYRSTTLTKRIFRS